jgi:hypothetical protein
MGPRLRGDDATTTYSRRRGQIAKRRDDLLRAVRLWHKAAAFGQVVFSDTDEAGGCDDLDRRPSAPDKSGEVQAIHRARHLDIGKYDVNVGARFEYRNRFVGIPGLDNVETGVADHFRRVHAQHTFIFDDKNDGPPGR